MSGAPEVVSADKRMADLGNEISDAIWKAVEAGLTIDVAASVVVGVAADYWLQAGYPVPVASLASILHAKQAQWAPGGNA